MEPGKPLRYDSHYERRGIINLFIAFEPLRNWRGLKVTDRRTKEDFAHFLKWLVEEVYPVADLVHLVVDNPNTHKPAVLYEAFPAEEARRLVQRLRFHYTPERGSWLNIAKIELSALSRQALADWMPDKTSVERAAAAWERERNNAGATVHR